MPIIITEHAKERMAKYEMIALQVENCLKRPSAVFWGKGGRLIAQYRMNGHVLRVIYEEKGNDIIVVTVYKARGGRYEV